MILYALISGIRVLVYKLIYKIRIREDLLNRVSSGLLALILRFYSSIALNNILLVILVRAYLLQ